MKRFFDLNGGASSEYDAKNKRGEDLDFSFLDLRDNSKINKLRKERERSKNKDGSSDSRILKGRISRTKSP